jgi:hypothetical protein
MECPHNHGSMALQKRLKTVTLGCNIWRFDADFYVCPVCGLEIEPDGVKKSGNKPVTAPSDPAKTDSRIILFMRKLRNRSFHSS